MPDTPEQLLKKLEDDMKKVIKEISNLLASRAMYRKVLGMVDANREIQKPSYFYTWMSKQYAAFQSLGVRRMVDWQYRSASLLNVMNNLWKVSHLINADRHAAFYRDTALGEETGRKEFEDFAVAGGQTLNVAMVATDIQTLLDGAKEIRGFVNRRVAHTQGVVDRKEKPVTFAQLDAALDLLDTLGTKYRLIMFGTGGRLEPEIVEWHEIFEVPWISREDPTPRP